MDLRGDFLLKPIHPAAPPPPPLEEEHTNTTVCRTAGTFWAPQHLAPAHLLSLPATSAL